MVWQIQNVERENFSGKKNLPNNNLYPAKLTFKNKGKNNDVSRIKKIITERMCC